MTNATLQLNPIFNFFAFSSFGENVPVIIAFSQSAALEANACLEITSKKSLGALDFSSFLMSSSGWKFELKIY